MKLKQLAATGLIAGSMGLMSIGLGVGPASADPPPTPHPGPSTHAVVPDAPQHGGGGNFKPPPQSPGGQNSIAVHGASPTWLQTVSVITASIAAIAASTSAFFATRTFNVARRATVRDKFISSLGETIARLLEMSEIASRFARDPTLIPTSRDIAGPTLRSLDAVINQLRILEPSLNLRENESGQDLLAGARSLAVDVRQADEFSAGGDLGEFDEIEGKHSMRPVDVTDSEWETLRYSKLYRIAKFCGYTSPPDAPYLGVSWEGSMRQYALRTDELGYKYGECCRRAIIHIVDNFIVPWGAYVVKTRLS